MGIFVKRVDGSIVFRDYSPFNIGDYVKIRNCGQQYETFIDAFLYFLGNTKHTYLESKHEKDVWKIINIALHPTGVDLMYHIRNIKGENAVISCYGVCQANFHKRNRENIRNMIIYQIPSHGSITPHTWDDKLLDYYDLQDGKIIRNERRKDNLI